MNRRQALVACRRGAVPGVFDLSKKLPHALGRDVDDRQTIDRHVRLGADERDDQRQRVSITALRVAREIALVDQMLQEKAANPRSEQPVIAHDGPPDRHSARSGGSLLAAAPVSW